MTQEDMGQAILPHLGESLFPGGSGSTWWMKSVQLDLESRGYLVRERTKPLRWYLATDSIPHYPDGKASGDAAESDPDIRPERKDRLRPRHAMSPDIRLRLQDAALMSAYEERPPYQRNDYLGWIGEARLPQTREKRISQMLSELAGGTLYMKMRWKDPKSKE